MLVLKRRQGLSVDIFAKIRDKDACVIKLIFVLFQMKIERSAKDGSSTFASNSHVLIKGKQLFTSQ